MRHFNQEHLKKESDHYFNFNFKRTKLGLHFLLALVRHDQNGNIAYEDASLCFCFKKNDFDERK